MKIRDIMTERPDCCSIDTDVQEVARHMRETNCGGIPIAEGERFVGFVTDRDIACRAVAEGRDARETKAGDVMTPTPVFVYDDQTVDEAADAMKEYRIRRIVVCDRGDKPIGIVSLADLVNRNVRRPQANEVLEEVSAPVSTGRGA